MQSKHESNRCHLEKTRDSMDLCAESSRMPQQGALRQPVVKDSLLAVIICLPHPQCCHDSLIYLDTYFSFSHCSLCSLTRSLTRGVVSSSLWAPHLALLTQVCPDLLVCAQSEKWALQMVAWEKQQKEIEKQRDIIQRLSGGGQSGRAGQVRLTWSFDCAVDPIRQKIFEPSYCPDSLLLLWWRVTNDPSADMN